MRAFRTQVERLQLDVATDRAGARQLAWRDPVGAMD